MRFDWERQNSAWALDLILAFSYVIEPDCGNELPGYLPTLVFSSLFSSWWGLGWRSKLSVVLLLSMSFLGSHPVCHIPCHKIDKNWRLHYQNDMPKLVCLLGKRWDGKSCQLFEEECLHFAMTHCTSGSISWLDLTATGMPWWRHHFTAMIGSKTLGAATSLSKRNIHAVAFALLFVTCKHYIVSTELCNQVSDFVTVALTCWRLFRFWLTHHQKEKSLTEYNSLAFSGSDHCWQRRCAFCSGV